MLTDCSITFLSINGVNDVPNLTSLISWYVPVVGVSIVPTLSSQVSHLAPDLEAFNDLRGRIEVTVMSLTLKTSLFLGSGVLESAVVLSAA